MYCSKCGTKLPDDAAFCFKCGAVQGAGVAASAGAEPRWETCEITVKDIKRRSWPAKYVIEFQASAVGRKGPYIAATSEQIDVVDAWSFDMHPGDEAKKVLGRLVTRLSNEGWDSTGGVREHWFSYRFRRHAK